MRNCVQQFRKMHVGGFFVKQENAIELMNVTKRFGEVIANDNVSLSVSKGEILSILGENGSGKTTLMNILSGIYFPDEGQIFVNGREVTIRSPKDSFALGIGMIHQHFKLVGVLTAAENIILGLPGKELLKMNQITAEIDQLTKKYGFDLNPSQKIYNMSVSQKQTVEIVKVLYRGADILILDEPTAVLTPQETKKLFDVLRNMRKAGKSIIIITHKLNEVLELSDRVTVLRKGKYVGTINTAEATVNSLAEMMVGAKVSLDIDRTDPVKLQKRLEVLGITSKNEEGLTVLKEVSFHASGGEILGIAGIAGSGQKDLLESIAGLQTIESGEILYYSPEGNTEKISDMKAADIRDLHISLAFVPEDRLGMGLVGSMDLIDNMMLRSYKNGKYFYTDRKKPKDLALAVVDKLDVDTPGVDTLVRKLSGGNVQKVLLGREIASSPTVLMVAYPVRGLDINSSYTIYNLLNEQKEKGVAVICVGEDLDVLLELCDRILVLAGGKVAGIVDARKSAKEELGLMMMGSGKGGHTNEH
jgi:general nucleoside transport system ATP-binding protein